MLTTSCHNSIPICCGPQLMLPAFRRSAIRPTGKAAILTPLLAYFATLNMPVSHPRSTSRSPSPSAKRIKLSAQASTSASAGSSDPQPELLDEAAEVERLMSMPLEFEKQYEKEIEYGEKLVLAPMVRTGSLPMRLMSLYYGAGLVWSPEVVDKAIIGADRTVDPKTGVITYSKNGGKPIFATHPVEKDYLIFQIGSSDPELAVKAAQRVQQDVAGIDLNCGCPKPFSTHAGMGAALLTNPTVLLGILRGLLEHIPLPISCKIRLLPTQPSTLVLAAKILKTGIRNLTVHCRTRDMRPGDRAMWERLGDIVKLGRRRGIEITCNGDGEGWANWEQVRKETGATSLMIARAAERNPSNFCPTGPVGTVEEIIPMLIPLVDYLDNHYGNTKFLLAQFKPSSSPISELSKKQKHDVQTAIGRSKTLADACDGLGITIKEGEGEAIFNKIKARIEALEKKDATVWEERTKAEEEGRVVDEPLSTEGSTEPQQERPDAAAEVEGWEVGVGQAQAEQSATSV